MKTLSDRLFASKSFEFYPGMQVLNEHGRSFRLCVQDISIGYWHAITFHDLSISVGMVLINPKEFILDLEDPGTQGCIRALGRKLWSIPSISTYAELCDGQIVWRISTSLIKIFSLKRISSWNSENEALVALIEAVSQKNL